ncbi:MAG TPA: MBL fold metallo-hydrolase, partial [Burkholderiaceae bacterium]|nr:MBL fold metallo-hydrolase [Burkholderiaceae bacterium]
LGTVTGLRPGLFWLRMGLPFALDHINLWLLEDEIDGRRGWTAIDTGIASDETRAAWEQLFETAFEGLPLLRLISTHFHPDHFGLAYWLVAGGDKKRWQVPLWMTATEYSYGRFLSRAAGDAAGEAAAAHFQRHGLRDAETLSRVRKRGGEHYRKLVPDVPSAYRRIMEGDEIAIGRRGAKRVFRIIVGYGHAPEHASLFCAEDKLLVAGDMVLPRISTNVSVFELEPEGDPLPLYLRSLDRYLRLPADTLVLPSHGKPFIGLHSRVGQQHAHHAARLAEVQAACARPSTAVDILPVLFKRELDLHQTTFALGESLAHLHALWYEGRVRRQMDGGIYRFIAE